MQVVHCIGKHSILDCIIHPNSWRIQWVENNIVYNLLEIFIPIPIGCSVFMYSIFMHTFFITKFQALFPSQQKIVHLSASRKLHIFVNCLKFYRCFSSGMLSRNSFIRNKIMLRILNQSSRWMFYQNYLQIAHIYFLGS
jgi:hypothetical protein